MIRLFYITKTDQNGRFIFWLGTACINRAENRQKFSDLMQLVKEFKEKRLN